KLFERDPAQTALLDREPASFICRSNEERKPVEWQADYYAACLLMPKGLVLSAWRRHFGRQQPFVFFPSKHRRFGDRRRQGLRPIADVIRRSHQPAYERVFDEVAKVFAPSFGVSIQAMRVRLEALGLLIREAPLAGLG